eukprot:scaffold31785_cov72-Phaeocystis_antarctica.AAC.6
MAARSSAGSVAARSSARSVAARSSARSSMRLSGTLTTSSTSSASVDEDSLNESGTASCARALVTGSGSGACRTWRAMCGRIFAGVTALLSASRIESNPSSIMALSGARPTTSDRRPLAA